MKAKEINDWLQVTASVGVVMGLILVALEIRESSRLATEQAISSMSGGYAGFLSRLDNPANREILIRAMEESSEFSAEESLHLVSLYIDLVNAAEADFIIGESRGLSADASVNNALPTTIWFSNRHGRAFWESTRNIYTPQFAARIDEALTMDSDGIALAWLKAMGEGVTVDTAKK
jgi:hypothetical protein